MKTLITIALGVMLAAPAVAAPPRPDDGLLLGDTLLSDGKDWDVVSFGDCETVGNIPATHLGIRVTLRPAEIDRVGVEFWNGATQELELHEHFRPGAETRWFDLRGEARCIKSVRIIGDTESPGRRPARQARVAFWARAFPRPGSEALAEPPRPPGGGPAAPAGAVHLGDVRLRDAKDWDILALGPCKAPNNIPVTKLGVRVTRHPAQIDRLEVKFWNDTEQVLQVRRLFEPSSESRWIDLRGEARCIKSIRIIGDTQSRGWRPGKQAQVAFWGKP